MDTKEGAREENLLNAIRGTRYPSFDTVALRDWFAGMAMQAIYGGVGAQQVADRDKRYDETNWSEVVASNAYEMADAMLKARQ